MLAENPKLVIPILMILDKVVFEKSNNLSILIEMTGGITVLFIIIKVAVSENITESTTKTAGSILRQIACSEGGVEAILKSSGNILTTISLYKQTEKPIWLMMLFQLLKHPEGKKQFRSILKRAASLGPKASGITSEDNVVGASGDLVVKAISFGEHGSGDSAIDEAVTLMLCNTMESPKHKAVWLYFCIINYQTSSDEPAVMPSSP